MRPTRKPDAGRLFATLRDSARRLRREAITVYLVARHPATPGGARLLAFAVAAYALSPIDLIPDFVPVLGYLDDLVLVPLGIWLVMRLVPPAVIAECRERAGAMAERPVARGAAVLIVALWLAAAVCACWLGWRWLHD